MVQLTLVLPFALPAPEFAPDLVRSLQAPALAALVSRTAAHHRQPYDQRARALPHEVWLARALGLEQHGQPGFAVAAMRGFGLDPQDGTWFIINPSHIEIARSHLMMPDLRQLDLHDADSRALFDAARPYIEEAGHTLEYGDAQTWFMRADDWAGMDTSTPDAAVGMNLTDCMPTGPRALAYRKLQNEIQMLWYTHPANAARESRRQAPVNAFWLWGAASATTTTTANTVFPAQGEQGPRPYSPHAELPKPVNGTTVASFETPGWLSALATERLTALDQVGATQADTLLIAGNVAAPAIAADWSGWLYEMQRLESELFAPLLAALTAGRIKQLKLVMSHRDAHAEFTTTAMAQRKFWRRPTLERLI
ncbi:hypothetical protein NX773_16170 [Massilia solisilvae]|uniref:Phosphoglycerate mutase n=1 Tax=Massilia solisilvae TaxID=1811225 RepID=A0ABT2BMH8_9BURK|nr:hypothetical protein [Massilia solisilvae]MCS0609704.1 hypothetical protein [Massilia solisilvae]